MTRRLRFPQWALHGGVVFTTRNVMEFGLEYRPASSSEMTDELKTELTERLQHILKTVLPERCRARVVVECRKVDAARISQGAPSQEKQVTAPDEDVQNAGLRTLRYFLLVRLQTPSRTRGESRWRGPVSYTRETLAPHLTSALLLQNQLLEALVDAGVACTAMTSQETFELMWRYYNPHMPGTAVPAYDGDMSLSDGPGQELMWRQGTPARSLAEQIGEVDCDHRPFNHLKMGSKEVFTVNLRSPGTHSSPGMTVALLGALTECNFYLVLDCLHLDQKAEHRRMREFEIGPVNMPFDFNSPSHMSRAVPDQKLQQTLDRLRQDLEELESRNPHLYSVGLSVVFICQDQAEHRRAAAAGRRAVSEMAGATTLTGTVQNAWQIIGNLAPFSGRDNCFQSGMDSGNAADLLPLWVSTGRLMA